MLEKSGVAYERVVKTRFDVEYHFDKLWEISGDLEFSNNHNCCDIFVVGSYQKMRDYSSWEDLDELYKKVFRKNFVGMNPHIVLHYHLGYKNIRYNGSLKVRLVRQ